MRNVLSALVTLLIALVLASGCGGGSGDGGGPSAGELLVVYLNILHGILDEDPEAQPFDRALERIPLIAEALAQLQPDVVFLQEVFPAGDDAYIDVRATVLEALGPEYTAVFGDITGGPIDTGALGQMTFTRLPIVSSENHYVGGPRAVHRVTVETAAGPVDLYNVHLEGTEEDPLLAIAEIEDVLAFINRTRTEGGAVILAGDFNAQPHEPMVQFVLGDGFIDALVAAGDATCAEAGDPGCTSSTKPLGDNPDFLSSRRIDYIFYQPGALSLDARTAELFLNEPVDLGDGRLLWPSDHVGVQTVLTLE